MRVAIAASSPETRRRVAARRRRSPRSASRVMFLLCAVLAGTAVWRLAVELGMPSSFELEGTLARWQAWFAATLVAAALAWALAGGVDARPGHKDIS